MDDTTRQDWQRRATDFAAKAIAPRAAALATAERPPEELWRAFADAGLFGLGLPPAHGGAGGDFRVLAGVAEAMVAAGGNMGLVLSWLSHQLIAGMHIAGHGSPAQQAAWLPRLAAGEVTPCLAVSEPDAGAHPKHLKTRAERDGEDIVLNGRKAYLTNGPLAGLFLVLAISGEAERRKQFSVYLVPRDTPGLSLTEGVPVDFLKPSPHCGLALHGCRLRAASRLGPEGGAMAAISLPMRRAEDALFAATTAGALRHALRLLAGDAEPAWADADTAELGRLAAAAEGLSALAGRAAALLDHDDPDRVPALSAAARDWAGSLVPRLAALAAARPAAPPVLAFLLRDLEGTLSIAGTAREIQARQRGESLLQQAAEETARG